MLKRTYLARDRPARQGFRVAAGWAVVPQPFVHASQATQSWTPPPATLLARKRVSGRLPARAAHETPGEPEPEVTPEPNIAAATPPATAPTPPAAAPAPAPAAPAPAAASAPSTSSSSAPAAAHDGAHTQSDLEHRQQKMDRLRVSLLAALSSLDRGLAANAREAAEVDQLCGRLEALGGPVALAALAPGSTTTTTSTSSSSSSTPAAAPAAAPTSDLLAGTWRLVYSSGFNTGSLGGRRPGPPAALFPSVLGQVYQRIDPVTAKLDNIVELLFIYGPPDLGLLGLGEEALGRGLSGLSKQLGADLKADQLPGPLRDLVKGVEGALGAAAREEQGRGQQAAAGGRRRESPAARLTLRHDYEVTSPATVKIVYEDTYGELVGSDLFSQLPRLEFPSLPEPLRPPKFLRSATFEVTFLDGTLRITRGDRGELRVYLRDNDSEAAVSGPPSAAAAAALDYDD